MKKLNRNFKCKFYIFALPFIICAVIAFLPWWIYVPTTLLGTMMWVGAFIILNEEKHDSGN
jgi:NADH:ubiquinone oxidoreductase subunit 3 (subunit A)